MCAVTVAVVGATVATTAYGAYAANQAQQDAKSAGGFTEKPLKGFAPTKGLQSYTARLLAENATATRPSLQDYAASGSSAKFPIKDTGFTPEEAAQLQMVDPHSGEPMPFVDRGQGALTPAQQVFLGQQRARQGATGPLAQYGKLTAKEKNLRAQAPSAGVATSGKIANKLGNINTKIGAVQTRLKSGGGNFPSGNQ